MNQRHLVGNGMRNQLARKTTTKNVANVMVGNSMTEERNDTRRRAPRLLVTPDRYVSIVNMRVEVTRSPRRHKTVQARLVDGTLRVAIPAAMTKAEEEHWVEVMSQRFRREADTRTIDLADKAAALAARFGLPQPSAIAWSKRQNTRWGSCSVDTGRIRISHRLAGFPGWVIDYVVVHELAHLIESGHTPRFWDLVNRYPLAERARGYLLAQAEQGA